MKRHLLMALALGALFVSGAAFNAAATAYDLYVLGGQSNMDGRGKAGELDASRREAVKPAIIYYRNFQHHSDGWQPLGPGFSIAPGYKGSLPSPTFGPEIGFASAMLRARPGMHLAILKACKGGTSLSKDWAPGVKGQPETQGPCYSNFLAAATAATQALKQCGDTYVLRGFLWHQGESDAHSTPEVYQARLTQFIARVREDLNTPKLPFVIGEVFDNGKRDSVRTAQRAVAKVVPHTGFAPANELKTWDQGTHFDAASQLTLGERLAEAQLKLN